MTALATCEAALLATAETLEGEAYASNTRRVYDAAWRGFQDWCRVMRLPVLPAEIKKPEFAK